MIKEVMSDIDKKLQKLHKLEEQNRLRSEKYLKKREKEGKVQISAIISNHAYELINNARDTSIKAGEKPETTGSIIERALYLYFNVNSDGTVNNSKPSLKSSSSKKNT
jgi:hypothetical protein